MSSTQKRLAAAQAAFDAAELRQREASMLSQQITAQLKAVRRKLVLALRSQCQQLEAELWSAAAPEDMDRLAGELSQRERELRQAQLDQHLEQAALVERRQQALSAWHAAAEPLRQAKAELRLAERAIRREKKHA